jgi:hypothetical protein
VSSISQYIVPSTMITSEFFTNVGAEYGPDTNQ